MRLGNRETKHVYTIETNKSSLAIRFLLLAQSDMHRRILHRSKAFEAMLTKDTLNYDSGRLPWFYKRVRKLFSRNILSVIVEVLKKSPFMDKNMVHLGSTRAPDRVLIQHTSRNSARPFQSIYKYSLYGFSFANALLDHSIMRFQRQRHTRIPGCNSLQKRFQDTSSSSC